jgi:hypothetical protein
MRTTLRGKVTLLFMTLGLVLAIPAVALADGLEADADDLVAATPHGNNASADQQPGTTVYYDFSAQIKNTGNVNNDVFPGTVNVSIARAGDWLAGSAGTPNSFNFSAYDSPQAGEIGVTVPCNANTTAGSADSKTITATLTAGTSTNGKTLSPDKQTLSYTITASGAPAASCAPANTPPTANAGGPYTFDEGSDTNALSGSGTDPDGTIASYAWDLNYDGTNFDVDSTDQNPNFDATNIDGPDTRTVALKVTDNGGAQSPADSETVNIANVAPTVNIDAITKPDGSTLGSVACLAGNTVSLDFSFTDPGTNDTHDASIDWGDNSTDTAIDSAVSPEENVEHTYNGPGPYTITATVTDDDGGDDTADNGASPLSFHYNMSGILSPFNATTPYSTFKVGSTIPVKVQITDCAGTPVQGLSPKVGTNLQNPTTPSDAINEAVTSTNQPDIGNTMRYSDGIYIFNLSTKNVSFFPDPNAAYWMVVREANSKGPLQAGQVTQQFNVKSK